MADVGDHLVLGEGRELGGAPGLAGRTRAAPEAIPALEEVLPGKAGSRAADGAGR